MSNVVNLQGEPMPEPTQIDEVKNAWNQLFDALEVLKGESQRPGFVNRGFTDALGRTWAPGALVRKADRDFNFVRERIARESHR